MKHLKKYNESNNTLSTIKKIVLMKCVEKIELESGEVFFRHIGAGDEEEWYDENDNYVRNDSIVEKLEEMYQSKKN